MPRTYEVTFEKVAVSAVQDLVEVIGAAGKMLRVKRQWVSCVDVSPLPAAQMLALRGSYLPATVTHGTGGSSPTPRPTDPGDTAASFTAKANSTAPATTSGTKATQEEGGGHIYSGYEKTFTAPPIIGPNESYVFELITAPSGSLTLSGGVEVEESGG
jgi:hypothetical protein